MVSHFRLVKHQLEYYHKKQTNLHTHTHTHTCYLLTRGFSINTTLMSTSYTSWSFGLLWYRKSMYDNSLHIVVWICLEWTIAKQVLAKFIRLMSFSNGRCSRKQSVAFGQNQKSTLLKGPNLYNGSLAWLQIVMFYWVFPMLMFGNLATPFVWHRTLEWYSPTRL